MTREATPQDTQQATPQAALDRAYDEWKARPTDSYICDRDVFHAGWNARQALIGPTPVNVATANFGVTPEDVYMAYPLHVGKQAAIRAIKKALKDTNCGLPFLLGKVQEYTRAVSDWPVQDRKYVPMPATWFNRGSYDDDPAVWQKGKPAYQSQFSQSH
jgi:hypothetical protein